MYTVGIEITNSNMTKINITAQVATLVPIDPSVPDSEYTHLV